MPLNILPKSWFNLSFDPKLQLLDFEAFGQGIDLVHNHQDAVLAWVYELVYLFDLAALKVRDVNHIDYNGPAIDLLENIFDDLSPVELGNVIGKLHGPARCKLLGGGIVF